MLLGIGSEELHIGRRVQLAIWLRILQGLHILHEPHTDSLGSVLTSLIVEISNVWNHLGYN